MCRYECGTELGDFDEKQYKYVELNGTLHTRERCESLRTQKVEAKKQEPMANQQRLGPLTIEELDARLKKVESFLFLAGKK
jgi:hypothetical protein